MNKSKNPTRSKFHVLKQICNFIPAHLVSKLARETGADKKARDFSNWSHVVALLHSQLAHSIGLNDVCDSLQLHKSALASIRSAAPPSRNGLSHANKVRDAAMAEKLFWGVLSSLQESSPAFLKGSRRGRTHRFRVPIQIVDATVIELVANNLDCVLLRYLSFLAKWNHSFTRLFTITRAALWRKLDLMELLRSYGTAGGHFRHLARPEQAYFPGFG